MFTSMFHNILPCFHIHSKQFNAVQVREVHNQLEVLAASKTNIINNKNYTSERYQKGKRAKSSH